MIVLVTVANKENHEKPLIWRVDLVLPRKRGRNLKPSPESRSSQASPGASPNPTQPSAACWPGAWGESGSGHTRARGASCVLTGRGQNPRWRRLGARLCWGDSSGCHHTSYAECWPRSLQNTGHTHTLSHTDLLFVREEAGERASSDLFSLWQMGQNQHPISWPCLDWHGPHLRPVQGQPTDLQQPAYQSWSGPLHLTSRNTRRTDGEVQGGGVTRALGA